MFSASDPSEPYKARAIRTLLLVDDDLIVLRAHRRLLRHVGFEVHEANGPSAALVALEMWTFALVVSDLRMPEHDGLWVLREVRDRQPAAVRVLCTGLDVDLGEHLGSGLVNGVLPKPFDRVEAMKVLCL